MIFEVSTKDIIRFQMQIRALIGGKTNTASRICKVTPHFPTPPCRYSSSHLQFTTLYTITKPMALQVHSHASFLGVPSELRHIIYEYILEPSTFEVGYKKKKITAIEILLIGNAPNRGYQSPYLTPDYSARGELEPGETPCPHHTPWALARVCRLVSDETTPLLAGIDLENIHFTLHAFTLDDLRCWTDRMGKERILNVKRWSMDAVAKCLIAPCPSAYEQEGNELVKGCWKWFHYEGCCYRETIVNLNRWKLEFWDEKEDEFEDLQHTISGERGPHEYGTHDWEVCGVRMVWGLEYMLGEAREGKFDKETLWPLPTVSSDLMVEMLDLLLFEPDAR